MFSFLNSLVIRQMVNVKMMVTRKGYKKTNHAKFTIKIHTSEDKF